MSLIAAAALMAGGCATDEQPLPSTREQILSPNYRVPVAVPAFNVRVDAGRPRVVQPVIVRAGQPAVFRLSVAVPRGQADSSLRVVARGREIFSVPAVSMRVGDPAIPVVVALPVDDSTELMEVRLELAPANSQALFEVSGASVTIGEPPPEEISIGPVR